MRVVWPILLFSACGGVEVPATCETFCQSAVDLYGACLEEWSLDWSDAGYADADAYLHSCETWAWEQAQFELDSLRQGQDEVAGRLHQVCVDSTLLFSGLDATCATYTDFDWSNPYSVGDEVSR